MILFSEFSFEDSLFFTLVRIPVDKDEKCFPSGVRDVNALSNDLRSFLLFYLPLRQALTLWPLLAELTAILCLHPLKGGIADALHHAQRLLLLSFCMSLCIHVSACAYVYMGIWKPVVNLRCSSFIARGPLSASLLFW